MKRNAPHFFEDNMNRPEFKRYLKSYCSEIGRVLPEYVERTKLFQEFSQNKYSDQVDLECELWEFFDKNLLKKKEPMIINPPVNTNLSMADFTKARDALIKANVPRSDVFVTFGASVSCQAPCQPMACKKQEKEDTMTYNETEASRKYLNTRLNDAQYAKRDDLYKLFNLGNTNMPKTYKELIAAIKDGTYTIDTKRTAKIDEAVAEHDGMYGMFSPLDGIKFNLPDAPDHKGYEAAEKDAAKQVTAAKDVINTSDAAAGLAALQAFEAWLPTVASSTSTSVQ